MSDSNSAARQVEETVPELSGAARATAQRGAEVARDVSVRTRATAEATSKAAGEVYSTFAGPAVDFHRQLLDMVRENVNASLDFVDQALDVKSPSAFFALSAEHTRKRFETFAEQARSLTGMAQKLTTDMAAPMRAGMKDVLNKAA